MSPPNPNRTNVFISYSHSDEKWLKRLQVHLSDLERRGIISLWDDTTIQAGSNWREEIRKAIDSAKVAVLLVSADFLASEFIAQKELPPLLIAAKNDGVLILPVIIRPSSFEEIEELRDIQTVNPPSRPLMGMSEVEQDQLLVKLRKRILAALNVEVSVLVEPAPIFPVKKGPSKRVTWSRLVIAIGMVVIVALAVLWAVSPNVDQQKIERCTEDGLNRLSAKHGEVDEQPVTLGQVTNMLKGQVKVVIEKRAGGHKLILYVENKDPEIWYLREKLKPFSIPSDPTDARYSLIVNKIEGERAYIIIRFNEEYTRTALTKWCKENQLE